MKMPGMREPIPVETDRVASAVVDAAYAVHSALGPGLLESVYETCMVHELSKRRMKCKQQMILPIIYDGVRLESGLRLDLLAGDCVVVEVKAVEKTLPIHCAQVMTYLRLSGKRLGLLINFNVQLIRDGIQRIAL